MMEFFNRLLLVTCGFAIVSTAHAQDPIREEKHVSFETDVHITCTGQDNDSFMWFRDKDRKICTPTSTWCSQKETKIPTGGTTSTLTLKNVLSNGIYTCATVNSAGERDVSITTLIVDPKVQPARYIFTGFGTQIITCIAETPNLEVILFRDTTKICERTWCTPVIDKPTGVSTRNFIVQGLTRNHTYSCVAYDGKEKLAEISVLQILVGPAPESFYTRHERQVMKGGFDLVEIKFFSKAQVLKRVYKIDDVEKDLKEDNFKQEGSSYSYSVSVGPVHQTCQLTIVIVNTFGSQTHFLTIVVTEPTAAKYGEDCYSAAICTGTDNTVCDPTKKTCECRAGYHWNTRMSICTNGALGRMLVQKEGILMLALAILLTLVRSTK